MMFEIGKFYCVDSLQKRAKLIHEEPAGTAIAGSLILILDSGHSVHCDRSDVSEWREPFASEVTIWLRARKRTDAAVQRISLTQYLLGGRDWSPEKRPGYCTPVVVSAREIRE
jgi:hypothetical protein